ncbi:MAG: hypothetical protein AAFY56_15760 [Pseudomonadota bacterium]
MFKTKTGVDRFYHLLGTFALLVLIFWTLAPLYWMIVTSLKQQSEIYGAGVTLWPDNPTFENYRMR